MSPSRFNEPQVSRILAGVSYMDKLLLDVEGILTAPSSQAFPKFSNPLTPAQVRTIRDYMRRFRYQVTNVLNSVEISLPPPQFDSAHTIRVNLQFIEVAIESLAPERLKGYGDPPPDLLHLLSGGLQEMKGIVRQLDSYLTQQPDADLSARLGRLASPGQTATLLIQLSDVIARHGFVEFRVPLSQLVEKIEAPAYEIAFFGHVSAGKSSLLNRIIGTDLLPTGVTPVTSVPTRIRNRSQSGLWVWSALGKPERYEIDRLPEFVTEQHNPRNEKRITRIVAELPLEALPPEIVLVDTPGLGSLALEGSAETLAYLPNCDLGVVLVDASSSLQPSDIAVLDALRSVSAASIVVLSKADVVAPQDLTQLLDYTQVQLHHQLRVPIDVAPLSSHADWQHLLNQWIDQQISPKIANSRTLAEASNARKAVALGTRVLHALEVISKPDKPAGQQDTLRDAQTHLREAANLLENASTQCYQITGWFRNSSKSTLTAVAETAISTWKTDKSISVLNHDWISNQVNLILQQESQNLARVLLDAAGQLSQALESAARVTGTDEKNDAASLDRLVKDLPPIEFSQCSIELRKPAALMLSTALALSSVKSQLQSNCGESLTNFVNHCGRVLELWFSEVLSGINRDFNANADIYRAQIQRLTAAAQNKSSDEDITRADITALTHSLGLTE